MTEAAASVRLDLWLWAARFFKTRSLARQAIDTGKVELDGQRVKPARAVHVGDALRIVRGEDVYAVTVSNLATVRGPASVARTLYAEDAVSQAQRDAARAQRATERAGYHPPQGRPDKRARRLIRALGDIDAS